jgi:DNA-directed RNA polymerase subunit RPC12/RpoP
MIQRPKQRAFEGASNRASRKIDSTSVPQSSVPQLIEAEIVDPRPTFAQITQCRSCGSPREPGSRFCIACGVPFEVPRELQSGDLANQADPVLHSRSIHCDSCGADFATTQEQRSYTCPFCDSNFVVDKPSHDDNRHQPEFVIGFAINKVKAQEIFEKWIKSNGWFRPGDLRHKAMSDKQRGVYLPFWHFTMAAESQWSANIGEHWYRTETYTTRDSNGKTQVHTRQVQETEWWPLSGRFHKYYYGFLVSASKGLTQQEAMAIQPFDLNALVRYRPHYLAGWLSEEYSIEPVDAISIAETEFRNRQVRSIQSFLPGDTSSDLRVSTELTSSGSDLILLPVHILTYRYHDKLYRLLINGQTGKIVGDKPWSVPRITAFVIACLLVIGLIALAVWLLSR